MSFTLIFLLTFLPTWITAMLLLRLLKRHQEQAEPARVPIKNRS